MPKSQIKHKTQFPKPKDLEFGNWKLNIIWNLELGSWNFDSEKRGFSLLETLVAVAILTLAITGTLSVVATNVTTASNAKDRVIASYLAQDALEYVRNMRDTGAIQHGSHGNICDSQPPGICNNPNHPLYESCQDCDTDADDVVGGGDWLGGLNECTGDDIDTDACAIDTTKDFGEAVLEDGSQMLFFDDDVGDGFYTYESSGNIETPFTREVLVCTDGSCSGKTIGPDEAVITVRMRWQPQLIPHEIIISEHIFNWQAEL